MERFFFVLGAVLAGVAVAAGAYGAHGGESALGPDQARWIAKAARYQMYHGLALLTVSWAIGQWPKQVAVFRAAGGFFLAGTLFFCGSLYLMAFSGVNLGYITPLGGVAFMIGWFTLAVGAWRG
ncbi:MAG: DUF423 domain-containing protein [Thermodesulfobacteriota bacterium]